MLSENHAAGMGLLAFESAAAATQAATGPRRDVHDDQRAWNVTGVTVYESVASATR